MERRRIQRRGMERKGSMCTVVPFTRISNSSLAEGPVWGAEVGTHWRGMLVWNEVMLIIRLWNMYCPAGGRIQSTAVTDLSAKSENLGTILKISWEFHIVHSRKDLIFGRSGSLKFCHLIKLLQQYLRALLIIRETFQTFSIGHFKETLRFLFDCPFAESYYSQDYNLNNITTSHSDKPTRAKDFGHQNVLIKKTSFKKIREKILTAFLRHQEHTCTNTSQALHNG